MTKQADFKRLVRARMAKTGESYATARSRLLSGQPGAPAAGPAGDWMAEALHVSNGDATDLPGTGLATRVLYWRDVLHEGPVPEVGPEELRRIRAAFLYEAGADDRNEGLAMFAERDRELAANRDGEYVLWFEADLYDQLQIIQILARLAELGVPAERITLICIGEHAGIARFGGLGELTAEQLRQLPATNAAARLTPAALDLATRAWAAFRAPTPESLGAIAAARLGDLRFLGEAFDRLSREYPATRDGLSLTERRLLAAVADGAPNASAAGGAPNASAADGAPNASAADGAVDAGTAFVRASGRETRPYLGDTWAFEALQRMARAPVPLLDADPADRPVERTTRLRLTGTGARVLAGDEDHVRLNGIDRYVGGVHLHGRNVPWRWDDGTESIVGPVRQP